MSRTKLVKNIQKLVDKTAQKRNLGQVHTGNVQNFTFKPPALVSNPDNPKKINNIIWLRRMFQHNRGAFHELEWEDFQSNNLQEWDTLITSNNGNFIDSNLFQNVNAFYQCLITVNVKTSLSFITKSTNCSIAIYKKPMLKTSTKVFGSGNDASFVSSKHTIIFDPDTDGSGNYILTIMYYKEDAGGFIDVSGDLGSYINSFIEPRARTPQRVKVATSKGIGGIVSKFLDGRNGPQLTNIIHWNKATDVDADVAGYHLLRVEKEDLGIDVVSGWNTAAFTVSGNQRTLFPIAGTAIIPGPDATIYPISGTNYNSDIDQTIVTISGTFSGSASNDIFIERLINIQTINQDSTTGSIISGTDLDIQAGETYTYQIQIFDSVGNKSPLGEKVSIVAGDFVPPGDISSLTAAAGNKSIELNWTNPSDDDLKGIHIWDIDNPVSGTDIPVQTLLKGSNNTVPNRTIMTQTTSGTLIDDWPYTFYASTFDWAGNEDAVSMPSANATTIIEIKTKRTGQRIETDTATNQLRFYDINDNEVVKIGEDLLGSIDGVLVTDGLIRVSATNPITHILDSDLIRNSAQSIDISTIRGRVTSSVDSIGNKTIGVMGIVSHPSSFVPDNDTIAIFGDYQGDGVINYAGSINSYAGYFKGADVYVEKNLIVSGTLRIDNQVGTSVISNIQPIFIRGTGLNNNANKILRIGNTELYNATGRGLRLTVIAKSDYSISNDTNYDTFGSTSASDSLATDLGAITQNEIGILTSQDAWESGLTHNLKTTFERLGLTHAALVSGAIRKPYAAIFEGTADTAIRVHRAVEVMQSDDADAPYAEISGWLIDGVFSVSPPMLPNALTYSDGGSLAIKADSFNSEILNNGLTVISGTGFNQLNIKSDLSTNNQAGGLHIANDIGRTLAIEVGDSSQAVNPNVGVIYPRDGLTQLDISIGSRDPVNRILQIDSSGIGISGTLIVDKGSVFNNSSTDVDFRVASNINANAFFIDGATGDGGFGTDSPNSKLHIIDDGIVSELTIENSTNNQTRVRLFRNFTGGSTGIIGSIVMNTNNSSGDEILFGSIRTSIENLSSGSEAARIQLLSQVAGVNTILMEIGPQGAVIGAPTGSARGIGTLNAQAVYDDNVLLTDFVFENDYEQCSIEEMRKFYTENKYLPTIDGRNTWEKEGKFSLGKIVTQLWETIEVQAKYIVELNDRLNRIENSFLKT